MAKVTAHVAVEDRYGDLHSPNCSTLSPTQRRAAAKAQADADELAARLQRSLDRAGSDGPTGHGHATGVGRGAWTGTAGRKTASMLEAAATAVN